jgi:LDH2 family malate/lactate/ureidoglycolate dehydrogenase
MSDRLIPAKSLRRFVRDVLLRIGYAHEHANDATDVLMWASLRGVDTHGVRNLKSYYVDRTLSGVLYPAAQIRIERETANTACLDGDSGLGLVCGCHAMRLATEKARAAGMAMVCVRNTHHLGPAGYYANMAVEHGMLGLCMTGHFYGRGHAIGIAPLGAAAPMFSTNPLSFAAPCGRYAPFVLDMSTAIATVNRIEMYGQQGRSIPAGWACDATGNLTTDASAATALRPLGGTPELGGYKGAGLAMLVTILSGILSGGWARTADIMQFDQPTMGHYFAAIRIDSFQPIEQFHAAMDAMIDSLHATPMLDASQSVHYPGEIEAATEIERAASGVPIDERLCEELRALADRFGVAWLYDGR